MNKLLLISIVLLSGAAQASDKQKYKRGDCITPTDRTYSWFREFARVDAFSEIDGFSGEKYILSFPNSISTDSIFSKDIEKSTKLTNERNCLTK